MRGLLSLTGNRESGQVQDWPCDASEDPVSFNIPLTMSEVTLAMARVDCRGSDIIPRYTTYGE